MEEYVEIGRMGKPHGTAGELKAAIETPYLESLLEASVVFLLAGGGKVPYFLESIRGEEPLLLKLEEVDSREAAQMLAGLPVFLKAEEAHMAELPAEEEGYFLLKGYLLADQELGVLGPIEEVLEFPQQLMAVIQYRGSERLIPLNDVFIQHIDQAGKKVMMNLPEGLANL